MAGVAQVVTPSDAQVVRPLVATLFAQVVAQVVDQVVAQVVAQETRLKRQDCNLEADLHLIHLTANYLNGWMKTLDCMK